MTFLSETAILTVIAAGENRVLANELDASIQALAQALAVLSTI